MIADLNRPDLIDAALLRPGRLDRLVYCGFSGKEERRQIPKALFDKVCSVAVFHGPVMRALDLACVAIRFSGKVLRACLARLRWCGLL